MNQANDFKLGRGLSSLIPPKQGSRKGGGEQVLLVPITDIMPNPHQPRTQFSEAPIADLVESIREHGILQPLMVSPTKTGYQLIAGERRFRAAKTLGLKTVPAIVRNASEQQKLEIAIVENVQRQDLNPIERALGYRKLIDEFRLTQEQVGKKVGQKRSSVANTLRLLALPSDIIDLLKAGQLTEGHAKVLLALDSDDLRRQLVKKILLHNLSVRETEAAISKRGGKKSVRKDQELADAEDNLQHALGTKVTITGRKKAGKISIEFYSEEDFKNLIKRLAK